MTYVYHVTEEEVLHLSLYKTASILYGEYIYTVCNTQINTSLGQYELSKVIASFLCIRLFLSFLFLPILFHKYN